MTFGLLQNVSDEYMDVLIQKLVALYLYMRTKVKGASLRISRHWNIILALVIFSKAPLKKYAISNYDDNYNRCIMFSKKLHLSKRKSECNSKKELLPLFLC